MTSHWWTSHWKEGACGGDVNNRGPGVVWGGQTLTLNTWWLTPGVHTPCDPPFLCRQGLWLVGNQGEMMSECFHKHMIGLCDTITSVAMLISLPCWFWRRKVIVRCCSHHQDPARKWDSQSHSLWSNWILPTTTWELRSRLFPSQVSNRTTASANTFILMWPWNRGCS